ncbi:MAG: M12 family metallo-peptidase, partial [Desulfobacterales bacterium]|nr:M12 family metallo-peptidase [Desulfobacterales bacterium]
LNDDEIFGVDKYDVGHVIGAGQEGGKAALGRVCIENLKAAGMSCIPWGRSYDYFAVGTFAHELGHQFGAYHTFASEEGSCNGNFNLHGAYEIGSGTTIMSYAGVCGANNITGSRAAYFHARSVENILSFITEDFGSRCGTYVNTDNTPPSVTVREGGFTIPINTPFVLEAEANDDDNDELMYNWQQYDGAATPENMKGTIDEGDPVTREEYAGWFPPGTSDLIIDGMYELYLGQFEAKFRGDGPLFRNFLPTTNNQRYFPRLSLLAAGDSSIKEVMPFTTRELNFVVSVSDEKGGISNDIVTFSSTDQAGPFVVTSSFSDSPYEGFSTYMVEWDIANTNSSPINCNKVN